MDMALVATPHAHEATALPGTQIQAAAGNSEDKSNTYQLVFDAEQQQYKGTLSHGTDYDYYCVLLC
jgi:hypothetical protein